MIFGRIKEQMDIEKKIRILALCLASFLFLISFYIYLIFSLPETFNHGIVIHIEEGSSLKEIAGQLNEEKIIKKPGLFRLVTQYVFGEKSVKAGDYFFEKPISLFTAAKRLAQGDYELSLTKVTIPEGATVRDIGFIFENLGQWQAEEFWEAAGYPGVDYRKTDDQMPWPKDFYSITSLLGDKPNYVGLEGYLFPDTYFFPPNITPEGTVIIILRNFDKKIDGELRQKISQSGHGVFEILTMASLIEKEAHNFEDRKLISGILWKRFEKDMLLQVDAPFVYAIGKNTFQLTKKDLNLDFPYNTYRFKGLPLGPIANPGLESIKAALEPKESEFWYYLSDGFGNVHYSRTFEEHKEKKEKYL